MSKTNPEVQVVPKAVSADICRAGSCEGEITAESLRAGLLHVGLIDSQDRLLAYKDLEGWRRGGGETYVSDFRVVVDGGNLGVTERHIIAKAIITFTDVSDKWREWKKRMSRLNEFGVKTPRTLCFWEGVVFQQFIPHDFRNYFRSCSSDVQQELKKELLETAKRVDEAGFSVTGFLHNLRTGGENIYMVDVGSDLGHYSDERNESCATECVHDWSK